MGTFRTAQLSEYTDWLTDWLNKGNLPTNFYDYPWEQWTWLTATRNFEMGGECGANSVNIIVTPGVKATGDIGHNQLYFQQGTKQLGHMVPVFGNPEFQRLKLTRTAAELLEEFIDDENTKSRNFKRDAEKRMARSRARAAASDIGRYLGR